jgi:hypothetical protein
MQSIPPFDDDIRARAAGFSATRRDPVAANHDCKASSRQFGSVTAGTPVA